MKNRLQIILSSLVIGIVVFNGMFHWQEALVNAQTDNAPVTPTPTAPTPPVDPAIAQQLDCYQQLYTSGNKKLADYQQYLTTHFASKYAASKLIAPALNRLALLKSDLRKDLDRYFQVGQIDKPGNGAERGKELVACSGLVDVQIADAEKMLDLSVGTNASVKKAAIMDEKYRQINDKLADLNMAMLKLSANLNTFEQKVPCYLKQCL